MFDTDLQHVAARLKYLLAGTGFVGEPTPGISRAAATLDERVAALLALQTWQPDSAEHGNTAGRALEPVSNEIGYSGTYLLAPLTLARAFQCPFSAFAGSELLLERLGASLRYLLRYIRPSAVRRGNWYAWDIAIPRWLSHVLVLCGEELPNGLREELVEALLALPFTLYGCDARRGAFTNHGAPLNAGGNTMEVLLSLLLRAVITGDRDWADSAARQIPLAMARSGDGEGLQPDGSFHFHGHGVNASYGHVCIRAQGLWLYLARETPWQCTTAEFETHTAALCGFFCLNAWRGRFAPHTLDRSVASPRGIYGEISGSGDYLQSLLFTLQSEASAKQRAKLNAALDDWLGGRKAEMLTGARAQLDLSTLLLEARTPRGGGEGEPAVPPIPPGTRYYPDSEYLLVRRPNWFAAALTNSPRTAAWRSILGAHRLGASSAEFSVALMSDGSEYTNSSVPTLNWRRLMNVTRCDSLEDAPESYGLSPFVGGLTDGESAVQAMQYLLAPPQQGTLRANKSLFVTRDSLVLLGTEIRCDADSPVATTLFHAPLVDKAVYLHNGETVDPTVDGTTELRAGDTLFLRNLALKVLTPARLTIETRDATYAAMHREETYDRMGQEFFEIHRVPWIYVTVEHGIRPEGAAYGAILWPDVAPTFSAATDMEIRHEAFHHALTSGDGRAGGEVRFPGDWRIQRGLSQFAAESAQWGSLALWKPSSQPALDSECELQITAPLRSLRMPNRGTEIFLPDNLTVSRTATIPMPDATTFGAPWPRHILTLMADGKTHHVKAEYR